MEVTKVVINACFGGFGLSTEAKREYLRRTGQTWTEIPSPYSSFSPNFYLDDSDTFWSVYTIDRRDPVLVAIVEEWGDRANDRSSCLEVHALPKGTLYRIDEYDGNETLETRDGIEWSIA